MPATQRVPVNFDTLNLQFSREKLGGHKGLMEVPNWLPKEKCLLFFISVFISRANLLSYFFSRTISHQVVPIFLRMSERSGYDRLGFAFLMIQKQDGKKLVLLNEKVQGFIKGKL